MPKKFREDLPPLSCDKFKESIEDIRQDDVELKPEDVNIIVKNSIETNPKDNS